jgi:hypothetical protein
MAQRSIKNRQDGYHKRAPEPSRILPILASDVDVERKKVCYNTWHRDLGRVSERLLTYAILFHYAHSVSFPRRPFIYAKPEKYD